MCFFLSKACHRSLERLFSTTASNNIVTPSFSSLQHISNLLKECKSLLHAKRLHQQAIVRGLLTSFSGTNIVAAYVTCHAFHDALFAVECYTPFSVFFWNALIREDVSHGCFIHALHLCCRMRCLGAKPDHFTFPFVLKACGGLSSYRQGTSIHGVICSSGSESNVFVCNALIAMYSRCGSLKEAIHVFDEILCRGTDDLVSWNSVMAACVQNTCMHLALETFRDMAMSDSEVAKERRPDAISISIILQACASLKLLSHGKEIHCFALRHGLFSDPFVGNAIVDFYAKCGMMTDALRVFEAMDVRDVVSWNVMVTGYSQSGNFCEALLFVKKMSEEKIALNVVTWSALLSGYAQSGCPHKAIDVFREMQLSGQEPNAITLISLLSACASVGALQQGKEIHAHALRRCLVDYSEGDDHLVQNALIDMYSKCKKLITAHLLFDVIPSSERNVVTWTVMIGGYAQHGDANTSLKLFSDMLVDISCCHPNNFTISCALMACARLSALHFGKQIHAYIIRHDFETVMMFLHNCLIDMYSKCGNIDVAQRVFNMMPARNHVSWASLMTGYGMLGHSDEVLSLFERMQQAGFVPDGVTFLVLLYACNHTGMVNQGMKIFQSMNRDFGVVADVEHYACAVDLLGRAGRLKDAQELIEKMPMRPTTIVWAALLSACKIHANVVLAEYASKKLLDLNFVSDGTYTLLSNIYASAGRWKDVARIRVMMKKSGIKKRPGCSWIQGKKGTSTVTFYAGDKSHPQSREVYAVLADIMQRVKAIGYVPLTNFALHDVDDEEKNSLLSEHSEKLALAYGILTSLPGNFIRITKNLRVCGDCHSAFIFISKIVDHEIILRDSSRFHHFKKGSCSCGGYW